MRELTEWIGGTRFPDKPWLLLGKGPTFARRDEFDLDDYNLLSLNHVVREIKVTVAHTMGVHIVEACAEALSRNCDYLVMPRRPFESGRLQRSLEEYLPGVPILRELDEAGRLIWYNYELSPPVGRSPVMFGRYSSSVAALCILATMGQKTVYSLGLDGGRLYSPSFTDLRSIDLQPARDHPYDRQFGELNRIRLAFGIDLVPLIPPGPGTSASLLALPPTRLRRAGARVELRLRRALRRLPGPAYDGLRSVLRAVTRQPRPRSSRTTPRPHREASG